MTTDRTDPHTPIFPTPPWAAPPAPASKDRSKVNRRTQRRTLPTPTKLLLLLLKEEKLKISRIRNKRLVKPTQPKADQRLVTHKFKKPGLTIS